MEIPLSIPALEETVADSVQGGLPERKPASPVASVSADPKPSKAARNEPATPESLPGRGVAGIVPAEYRTSHLESLTLIEDRVEIEQKEDLEITAEVKSDSLPNTLTAAHAALQAVHASQPKDTFEAKVKAAKITRLAARIHELSQGPKAQPLNHAEYLRRTPPAEALAYVAGQYQKPPKSKKS